MRPITILVSFALLVSSISPAGYAQDSKVKEKLTELASLIDKEPPFSFRDGLAGKLLFKGRLKQASLLVEGNKLEDAGKIIFRLFAETQTNLTLINPIFRKDILQRLIEILTQIPKK